LGRERECGKKQIQKPSSSPAAHLGEEEEEQCRSKQHHFGLLLFFFLSEEFKKRRCFDQNASFSFKRKWCQNMLISKSVFNFLIVQSSPQL
jgi:hypothetical protein